MYVGGHGYRGLEVEGTHEYRYHLTIRKEKKAITCIGKAAGYLLLVQTLKVVFVVTFCTF